MSDKIFVDTNVLIYAHDLDAGEKYKKAALLLERLWEEGNGVISTQVLQEFYVNVTKKITSPLSPAQARGVIENYLLWHVEVLTPESVLNASEISERHHLSFWDAMIVHAARRAGAEKVLTEDLSHNQFIEGIRIENPFK